MHGSLPRPRGIQLPRASSFLFSSFASVRSVRRKKITLFFSSSFLPSCHALSLVLSEPVFHSHPFNPSSISHPLSFSLAPLYHSFTRLFLQFCLIMSISVAPEMLFPYSRAPFIQESLDYRLTDALLSNRGTYPQVCPEADVHVDISVGRTRSTEFRITVPLAKAHRLPVHTAIAVRAMISHGCSILIARGLALC